MKTIITGKPTKKREKLVALDKIPNIFSSISYNIDHNTQIQYLNNLYLDISFNEKTCMFKELRLKQTSYKSQDIEKQIYNESTFITLEEIIEKLVVSQLQCFYCREKMKILFENVRDPVQWTLDRKNNNLDHSNINTIICCLQCNLQRRKKGMEAFRFTKQLKIVRNDY